MPIEPRAATSVGDVLQWAGEMTREIGRYKQDAARVQELNRTLEEFKGTRQILDEVRRWVEKIPTREARKKGSARHKCVIAYARANQALLDAMRALSDAAEDGADIAAGLALARGQSWLATLRAGEAHAWMQASQVKGHKASRASQLRDLAIANPSMSAAKLNAMLRDPLDEPTARRVIKRAR